MEQLKRGIVLVFVANLINLLVSLITGFMLPKYISVETYAAIKSFQLIVGYIGIMHFGYIDGLYLKYGGRETLSVSAKELNIARTNLFLSQMLCAVLICIPAIFARDLVWIMVAICVVPINMTGLYKSIYQATGEFNLYSRVLNYTTLLTLIFNIMLVFVFKTDNSFYYLSILVFVYFLVWGIVEVNSIKKFKYKYTFTLRLSEFYYTCKSGISLTLGNFSSILMTSMDRWFIKLFFNVVDFAYYSFAVSIQNLLTVFITPIVTTLYNYMCKTIDPDRIKEIKNSCTIFALYFISTAYGAKFILEIYLNKYLEANNVIFILFVTEIFFLIIKAVYVNIYKAKKQQKLYFQQLSGIIILGVCLNFTAVVIFKSNESIAIASMLSAIVWMVICEINMPEIRYNFVEIVTMVICSSIFLVTGVYLPAIFGFIVYIISISAILFLLQRKNMYRTILLAKSMVNSIIKRKI